MCLYHVSFGSLWIVKFHFAYFTYVAKFLIFLKIDFSVAVLIFLIDFIPKHKSGDNKILLNNVNAKLDGMIK